MLFLKFTVSSVTLQDGTWWFTDLLLQATPRVSECRTWAQTPGKRGETSEDWKRGEKPLQVCGLSRFYYDTTVFHPDDKYMSVRSVILWFSFSEPCWRWPWETFVQQISDLETYIRFLSEIGGVYQTRQVIASYYGHSESIYSTRWMNMVVCGKTCALFVRTTI